MTLALRRRSRRGLSIAVALFCLFGTAVCSHTRTPTDASKIDGQPGVVCERVIDGDTIVIDGRGFGQETVRLRGIDAPEIKHPGVDTDAYFGRQSKAYLAARLEGKPVTLKFDATEKRDRYQRLLAYVYINDSECINVSLVRDGMAYVDRRFKTVMQAPLDAAETQARTRKIGLWKGVNETDMPAWRQKWLAKKKLTAAD